MSNSLPVPGQRWVSDSEPELGLGIILKAEFGRVEIFFPAAAEQRQYALKSAPIRRVQFQEGDRIKLHSGEHGLVAAVEESGGLLSYRVGERAVPEAELSDTISFSKPEDRLLAGQVDERAAFALRVAALHRRGEMRKSPVRGFTGGRVDLLPHQLSIAREVSARLVPRVLLADEVGLGKTIEAGLILHRLHLTGRAERALILVPEPLIHQWFVEFLRRFNLLFSLFDEERCAAIEQHDAVSNPFLDSQLVICSVAFLTQSPARAAQAAAAGWDLLVVDEAHHLAWAPGQPSEEYSLVEKLAARAPGVLLLTATPQQLGPEGHFARLRLLDPDRYADLARFLEETTHYEQIAKIVERLRQGKAPLKAERELLGEKSPRIRQRSEALTAGDEAGRADLISALLDEFGIGRVMFRNTRAALSGFPERKARLAPLEAAGDGTAAKIKWLAALLKKLSPEKVLLICRTRALAEQIHTDLQRELNVACALFHEGLTLLQRDRNAAFFAEAEGARVLICSEIGSEGRNFQFAHHLVLFDLPRDPDLLEQRIGRLDRIGQTGTIQIHVPFCSGTGEEAWARWYHEGLDALAHNPHGAGPIAAQCAAELAALETGFDPAALAALLVQTRERHSQMSRQLERGHDRLLAHTSCRAAEAAETIERIRELDGDTAFEEFFLALLDHFGVQVEDLAPRTWLFRPGPLRTEAFPALPEEGLSATFDRKRALSREDLAFVSRDHPLVRGALDLLLGAETGNSAFSVWKSSGKESVLLEIYTVMECVAPAALHADRFLPATPLRVVVDHALEDQTEDAALAGAALEKGDVFKLLDRGAVKKKLLPAMLAKAQALAEEKGAALVAEATAKMERQLGLELERLADLRELNDHVRPEEVELARKQQADLRAALATARPRLDTLHLILRMA